jgi:cytochrome P450 PksS
MCPTPRAPYDLTNPQALAEGYLLFRRLREGDPVHWSEPIQAWVLTRYPDVLQALRDPRLSNRRTDYLVNFQLRNSDPALAADYARISEGMMLMKDGADHHRLRVLGNGGFTPSLLDRSLPLIQRVMDELLDQVQGRSRFDVVADLAQPLPAVVIAELFGIPPEDRRLFQQWSDDAAQFFGGTLGDPEPAARAANAAALELERYFAALLEQRRRAPGDDLMSLLLAGQAEGKLSAEEVCHQCVLLLVGGHVTTIDQFANAVHAFLEHPDQLRKLRDNPGLIRSAVEEALRYDGAVPFIHRVAAADLEIGGRAIRRGQAVYLGLAAANRDPELFAEPDRFDITRTNNRHLSFGAGPHVCLGGGLARRELEVGLLTLFRRMPTLRLDGEDRPKRRCESLVFRGFHRLPAAV